MKIFIGKNKWKRNPFKKHKINQKRLKNFYNKRTRRIKENGDINFF